MKRTRIIVGAIFALIILAIDILVVYYWRQMGCSAISLIAALIMYTGGGSCIWFCIDQAMITRR